MPWVVDIDPAESILGIFTVLVTVEPHPPTGVDTTDMSPAAANDIVKVT